MARSRSCPPRRSPPNILPPNNPAEAHIWPAFGLRHAVPCAAFVTALTAVAGLAAPADTAEAHLTAAKAAAGFDFTGTLARVCISPQTGPGRDVAPGPAPDRSTYITDPAKVFDNL